MNIRMSGFNFGQWGGFGGIDTSSKQYKAAMKMLGVANKGMPMNLNDPHQQLVIKNYMKSFDADGDYINPRTGIAGMCVNGIPVSERHKIINVSEDARQKMFDETKRHFLEENGKLNGRTTKRSEVFQAYQRSVPKNERLKGTWTLSQYERQYRQAMISACKEADPSWDFGKPIPAGAVDGVTREKVDGAIISDGVNLSTKKIDYIV
ncbi:MAG: DUF3879 family protein [Oribacterium sp.]|nr:DUF3879 family protein [Oribacterium sp.]